MKAQRRAGPRLRLRLGHHNNNTNTHNNNNIDNNNGNNNKKKNNGNDNKNNDKYTWRPPCPRGMAHSVFQSWKDLSLYHIPKYTYQYTYIYIYI